MYEASFKPSRGGAKTPDPVKIIQYCRSSKDKNLNRLAQECSDGEVRLTIDKRFIDARHGKTKVNFRFDFEDYDAFDAREQEIMSLAFLIKMRRRELQGILCALLWLAQVLRDCLPP